MPIVNLFSKRIKAKRGEFPDVYQYTNFDRNLKVKIVHIISGCFHNKEHLSGIPWN